MLKYINGIVKPRSHTPIDFFGSCGFDLGGRPRGAFSAAPVKTSLNNRCKPQDTRWSSSPNYQKPCQQRSSGIDLAAEKSKGAGGTGKAT